MEFAKKQLEKYGWEEGKGLGKNGDGITTALKPILKFDNAGIGHDIGNEFKNNWWERMFNNASKNIDVQIVNSELIVKQSIEHSVDTTIKNCSSKSKRNSKDIKYGSFVKTERLTENCIESCAETAVAVASAIPCSFVSLTDDQLFSACGGRTAHKGARHGLKLGGKLSRIEKQEKILLKRMKKVSLEDNKSNMEKKIEKIKKQKKEIISKSTEFTCCSSIKKRKKKNVSKVRFNDNTQVKYFERGNDDEDEDNNNNKNEPSNNNCTLDEGIEQDLDDSNSEQDSNHKSFEQAQLNINDLSKAERKKLKKKRKLEQSCATAKFLMGLQLESSTEDGKSKKRKGIFETRASDIMPFAGSKRNKCNKIKKQEFFDRSCINSITESLDNSCRILDDK